MPKSRKRSAAKAKAVSRQRPGTREGRSPWMTVPRTTYGQVRPAPPPGRQWPTFNESPWLTWAAFSALRKATPEERAELGMPPAGVTPEGLTPDMQLALVEIAPWRIAPGWADAPLSDRRAEWTSLAAEATLSGNIVADLVEHLADLEERGLIKWDQEPRTALLAANLDEALKHPGRGGTETPVERDSPVRRILPPSRDAKGHPSPSWLLVQAAQLAIETSSVLHVINGTGMNLAEERRAQSEAAALLENAARAAVIMESGMPLAAAWSEGPPRARAIFARAREAGSDVASVMPDFALPPTPPVPPEIRSELEQASWKDPECGTPRSRSCSTSGDCRLSGGLTATGGCRPDWRCRRRPR